MIDRDYCSGIWDIGMFYEPLDVTRCVGRVNSMRGPSQLDAWAESARGLGRVSSVAMGIMHRRASVLLLS